MIEIQWMPITIKPNFDDMPELNIVYIEPQSAIKYFLEAKEGQQYLKCPAFIDYLKNSYIIKSPYDLEITLKNDISTINNFGQTFYDNNIKVRMQPNGSHLFHLMPRYLFITNSKKPVKLITQPIPLYDDPNPIKLVPGQFDITKWCRPIVYTTETYLTETVVKLKRGQPLFMVKFDCDDTVILKQGVLTKDIEQLTRACLNVKHTTPKMNLKSLYKMANGYMTLMKKRIFKSS